MPEERDAQKDLAMYETATKGEWYAEGIGSEGYVVMFRTDKPLPHWIARVYDGAWEQIKANAHFIAESHTALPYWIRRCIKAENSH